MLPQVATNTIQTTVKIPDGGTLLIGGQRTAGEITREMGVPILSKVPIINRLFTNRASSRDEVIILMLIKPTIIISREYEEDYYSTN
jgi:type II secretory pathway component GspD/PulD (secretin)